MRLLSIKRKFLFYGIAIVFLCYFSLNYISLIESSNERISLENILKKRIRFEKIAIPKNNEIIISKYNETFFARIDLNQKKNNIKHNHGMKLIQKEIRNSNKTKLIVFDTGGFGSNNNQKIICSNDKSIEIFVTESQSAINRADIIMFHMEVMQYKSNFPLKFKNNSYKLVFSMESEVHSFGGESWNKADFRMWYNLDLSYPEPATYFDIKIYLIDLLSPPIVEFNNKVKTTDIVWVVSNCNAFNGREKFIKKLMQLINVDSYGECLKNHYNLSNEHMKGNIELYSKYKFVIAIENSNCEDYVTEKLVHAVASGSIPIVAGRDGKPNYLKFLPANTYINIYDFKTPEDIVKKIKSISSNQTEYEKYIYFKQNHNFTREDLKKLKLNDLIQLAQKLINKNDLFFKELIKKEKSESKLCKLARYLKYTPSEVVKADIEKMRMKRPDSSKVCIKKNDLDTLL